MANFSNFINIAIVLVPFVIFLVSLIYLLKTYFLRREHLTKAATVVFIAVFITVIVKIILSAGLQYYVWKNSSGLGAYFLPPHQSISYFLKFVWQNFILSPFAGLVISLIMALYFWLLNRIFKKQYLDFEDILILVSGAMIAGWPNVAIFMGIAFILTVFRIFYLFYIKREMRRVPITAAFIIAAFLTLLIGDKLVELLQLGFLRF